MRRWLFLGFAAGLLTTPLIAEAQPAPSRPAGETAKDQARHLADDGQRLFDAGDYRGAIERLREADTKFGAPTIKLAVAEAHEKLGELIEAREAYQRVAAEDLGASPPREFQEAQEQAVLAVARLDKAIPAVVLALVGPTPEMLSLTLDGKALSAPAWDQPISMNPGSHTLVVETSGRPSQTLSVSLKEGETRRIYIRGAASPPPEPPRRAEPAKVPSRSYTAPAVALGVGGAGLLVGAIAGGLALSKMGSFRELCGPELQCPPSFQGELEGAKVAGHLSTVGFAAFGVGAAMGAVLLLWPAPRQSAPQQSLPRDARQSRPSESGGRAPASARVSIRVSPVGVVATGNF